MWDLCRPGFELVSPALAGGFLTTAPPGKSLFEAILIKTFKLFAQGQTGQWKRLENAQTYTYVKASNAMKNKCSINSTA